MTELPPRLRLTEIRKSFGATVALDGVNLTVAPGEVHAIIGENGAGKSTLMKVLSGSHRVDSGTIELDGEKVELANPRQSQAAGVAMIYQELNLAPDLTVAENIVLGHEPRSRNPVGRWLGVLDRRERNRIAESALARLHCEHLPLDRPVHRLSIAQQQMIEIARAVTASNRTDVAIPNEALASEERGNSEELGNRDDPQPSPLKLLILDEPTSSLTQVDTEHLFQVIEKLKAEGVSILYISHFLEECQRIADRFTVLRDGCSVGEGSMDDAPMDRIIRWMVGREISELYPKFTHSHGEVVLETKALKGKALPRGIDLRLHRGEIFGVAGLIGAGRTETLRAIFGLDPIESGSVRVGDRSIASRDPKASWSKDSIGLVSENRKSEGLFLNRSLTDNLTATRMDSYGRGGFLASKRMHDDTAKWMENLQVKATGPEQAIGELSGGNQQKIAFGRLLHHDCEILLLDEPTRGIDIGSKSILYQRIGELAAGGKAILIVSSYLPELLGICDTIGVVAGGRMVEVRKADQWTQHELLEAAIG